MAKRALITGINGQDGSYLTEYLLELGYHVGGLVRRSSVAENQTHRINNFIDDIETIYADLLDVSTIEQAIKNFQPDEVYNLAAQSHVRISFDMPAFTASVNAIGALNVFQAIRTSMPSARVYQASSSEMFGDSVDPDGFQRESTPMHPVSPYGCSKLFAYSIARNYRKAYKLYIGNGILFNHESPRRGSNFVSAKLVQAAIRIKLNKQSTLVLGNLDSYRDWGHSKDYVRAMHLIVNHTEPSDFVVATGETHSVRDICQMVFEKLDMNYQDYVRQDSKYMRPEELPYLKGDCSRIRSVLGWIPEYNLSMLMDDMIEYYFKLEKAST